MLAILLTTQSTCSLYTTSQGRPRARMSYMIRASDPATAFILGDLAFVRLAAKMHQFIVVCLKHDHSESCNDLVRCMRTVLVSTC